MIGSVRRKLRELRQNTSGNAMMLLAIGLPTFIGGGGLAVDTAQWYMWKRELQFAVDQAALAGAWAMTNEELASDYDDRAKQEYADNVATVEGIDLEDGPTVRLGGWNDGNNNSVIVEASATKMLPFTGFLTGDDTTVTVSAQAAFEAGGEGRTACMTATDDDADGAITINGNVSIQASCGMAALSVSDTSIIKNGEGSGDVEVGYLLSRGEIDDYFDGTDNEVYENLNNLRDPFEDLSPPSVTNSETYSCPKGKKTADASWSYTESTTTVYKYTYGTGNNTNNLTPYTGKTKADSNGTPTGPTAKTSSTAVSNGTFGPTAGTPIYTADGTVSIPKASGKGSTTANLYEIKTPWVTTTISGVTPSDATYDATGVVASVGSGVYEDGIDIKCDTVFTGGVYVIRGAKGLNITGNYSVTSSAGVMFVLENGADFQISGTPTVNLTAMTSSELDDYVSVADAEALAGMLIFESRTSSGSTKNKITGTSNTTLNGTIYLPVSGMDFSGTVNVTSQCLMIAANTITISGNVNMETFCPDGLVEDSFVSPGGERTVKLVA